MSYDVMVFDPDFVPHEEDRFRDWYENEINEEAGLPHYTPEVAVNDGFRLFYGEMKAIFFPFNGPDNIDPQPESPPIRHLRTCEYAFRPYSAYLQFRWSAQDFARAACSMFAKELGLGIFLVSSKYPQARLPGDKYLYPYGNWKKSELKTP